MPKQDKIKVILNPSGGRLSAREKLTRVRQGLEAVGLDYELSLTSAPGHATELAHQAVIAGWPIVAAAGGDGTIGEVVNGLMAAATADEVGALGIIPLGTGNDLADMLELPRNTAAACHRLAAGQTRLLDVGQVNGYFFVNNSAIGLEPMVSIAHEEIRWLKGNARYIVAALKAILQAKSWSMIIRWDDVILEGPMTLVSVGNSRRTGGVFYMTPEAKLDDGLLDFIYAPELSRWDMLKILPQTFTGQHIHHPLVTYRRTTALSITSSPPTPIQADGEVIDRQATDINYRVIPGKLRVIV